MRPTVLLIAAAVAAFATAVAADEFKTATPAELAMKDVAFAPGAPAVVLDWEQRRIDNSYVQTEYVRIKVLTADGVKYGTVEIPYDRDYSSIARLKARMTKPDGTVVPFDGKVYDKTVVRGRKLNIAAKAFTFPDVTVGSILEYHYDVAFIHMREHLVYDTDMDVQRDLPVVHSFISITPYTQVASHSVLTYRLPPGKVPQHIVDRWELELNDLPPLQEEPYEPPSEETRPNVKLTYRLGEMDEEKYWKKEAERWTGEIEGFISDRTAVRSAAQSAIAGVSDPHDRLQKLYAIAQNVRNLTFEPDKTRQESNALRGNRSAEDVLRNGYGTSDEINRLFVALARGAGFDAAVIRVADRSERFFAKEQQQGDELNNEIALVTVEGKPELSDPGTPLAPYGLLAWQKTGVNGLRIDRKSSNWLWIPEQPPLSAMVRRTIELHLEADPPLATVIVMRTGQAALAQRLELLNDDEAAAKAKLVEQARRLFPDGTPIKLTNVNGLRNSAVPLIERYEVALPALATVTGSRMLLPLSICTTAQKPPFTAAERRNPIYFEYRWRDDDEVTLTVPRGYEVESLPAATNHDLGGLSFKTQYEQENGRVRFTRHLIVDAVLIDKAKYGVVRDFFNGVAAADQQQIVLRRRASQ